MITTSSNYIGLNFTKKKKRPNVVFNLFSEFDYVFERYGTFEATRRSTVAPSNQMQTICRCWAGLGRVGLALGPTIR
jgi:hypothetical protein